ncbi:hypothetical protein [Natrinema sp. 1APR25-10V2]|uniref:hypothetical protein n=1 Tax=Natrinema sp. 1APR25-10V2 TaxID=2951081 RepID=UPI0028761485|nr:hypothetical protein [Natrinema sp. 1APR25-10V2]MDS0475692.1 hypothetical protein [Natrinema sp. 1APR25-10V2]
MDIGIAISLYDKFDELSILVDIIRNNWEDEYFISVCSNHENAEEQLKDLNIDRFETGDSINYTPEMNEDRRNINLNNRVLDTFKKSTKGLIGNVDYGVHIHADAWFLSEKSLKRLVENVNNSEKYIGVRGLDPAFRRPKWWVGNLMDQFILFDIEKMSELEFFEFNTFDLLPHTSVHTSLGILLLGKVGWSNVYHYSDFSKDLFWDGSPTGPKPFVRPAVYNPEWDLFHLATQDFPDDLGEEIQAYYLREYGLDSGDYITEFLSKYNRDIDEVNECLHKLEKRQNKQLKRMFFDPYNVGRRFEKRQKMIEENSTLRKAFENIGRDLFTDFMSVLFKISPFPEEMNKYPKDRMVQKQYWDAEWPNQDLSDIYSDNLNLEDYPSEYEIPWDK